MWLCDIQNIAKTIFCVDKLHIMKKALVLSNLISKTWDKELYVLCCGQLDFFKTLVLKHNSKYISKGKYYI